MEKLSNLSRSSENNLLWPSIADAVDTFLRRRDCEADSYERIWRLIHIWEAAEITLSVSAIAKLRTQAGSDSLLLKCREFFYGVSWDQVTETFKASQGASKGSVDQWINILFEVSTMPCSADGFMGGLCRFLQNEAITLEPLVLAWSRACDVPPDARSRTPLPVKQAMRHINTFRNRFAHVPFPHDPLEDLAGALENVTEQLFSIVPVAWSHFKDGMSSPLTGLYRYRSQVLRGIMRIQDELSVGDRILFEHPIGPVPHQPEQWEAEPFVHIDSMMRPHILTRVDDEGIPEYTRHRAEANAVIVRHTVNVHQVLAPPRPADYESQRSSEPQDEEEEIEGEARPQTMTVALDAIRAERFDEAIEFFRDLTQVKANYHIGWLRLGHAEREKALRVAATNQKEAEDLLEQSAKDLGVATRHRDSEYVAQAFYERSKAFFHLARLKRQENENFDRSLDDARAACKHSSEYKYRSWLDYVNNSTLAGTVTKPEIGEGQKSEPVDDAT